MSVADMSYVINLVHGKEVNRMDMRKISFTAEQVLGGDTAILTGQKPLYEYKDNKRTDNQIGMTYTVLAFQNGTMESVNIKVEGAKVLDISDDEIIEANKSLTFIFVKFDSFVGKPYNNNNGCMAVSCSASGVEIVNKNDLDIFGE